MSDISQNAVLMALSKVWQWDGDLMRCRSCQRPLIASRDGEELRHKSGCPNEALTHPWSDLRSAIRARGTK